jgi:hypothetical protein
MAACGAGISLCRTFLEQGMIAPKRVATLISLGHGIEKKRTASLEFFFREWGVESIRTAPRRFYGGFSLICTG